MMDGEVEAGTAKVPASLNDEQLATSDWGTLL